LPRAPYLPWLPRRIAPVAPATSIPFEAAKAHRRQALLSWPTGLYPDSMTIPEPPLPNLLGFIADEDKEFQASLARDRAEITLWDQIQVFSNQRFVVGSQQDAATERLVLKRARVQIAGRNRRYLQLWCLTA
jgi:hypothetical protein